MSDSPITNGENFQNDTSNLQPAVSTGFLGGTLRSSEVNRNPLQPIDMFGYGRPSVGTKVDDDDDDMLVGRFDDSIAVHRSLSEETSANPSCDGRVDFTAIAQAITASNSESLDASARSQRRGTQVRSTKLTASQTGSFVSRISSRHITGASPKKMTAKQSHMNSMILNLAHNNQSSSLPIGTTTLLSASSSVRALNMLNNRQPRSDENGVSVTDLIYAPSSPTSSNFRQSMLNMKLKRRSEQLVTTLSELQQKQRNPQSNYKSFNSQRQDELPANFARRFKVGDYVLVRNSQSKWANLVNRYGFPHGVGETDEERRGPYNYVLATITKLHFEEIKTYYTVTRCDTGADQRADLEFMEPLRTPRGELAALKAATEASGEAYNGLSHLSNSILPSDEVVKHDSSDQVNVGVSKRSRWRSFRKTCYTIVMWPFYWIWNVFRYTWDFLLQGMLLSCFHMMRRNARLFLNGKEPYVCQMRLTIINLVVVCSTWLMFVDQVRLGFMPPTADRPVAIVNLCVWVVLSLELIFEVFIRPDGFNRLIISEKAFSPTTVLYINSFHFIVESLSLLVFIPEFYCILSNENCSQRYRFSFYNAALLKVIGPTRLDVAYGYGYLALVRLRVLGLVR